MTKPLSPETLYLSVDDVAARFSVSTDTIWRWTRLGKFPKPVKIGAGTTRWRMSDLLAFEATLPCDFAMVVEGDVEAFFAQVAA